MFVRIEQGVEVYKKEVTAFLRWYKDHHGKIKVLDSHLDSNLVKFIRYRTKIEGMSQALGMKKKEVKDLNASLGLTEKMFLTY
jgi:hypothetical protein